MGYLKRTDSNHVAVMFALRRIGATVQSTHMVGVGFPDIVVGYRRKNFLLEIKDGRKTPSRRALTDDEAAFHKSWNGQVETVNSPEEAVRFIMENAA